MFGLGQDTKPPKLFVQIFHEVGNAGTDGAEVMVIQFLSLGGIGTEQSSAGETEVLTLGIQRLGDQEVLLLRAYADLHPLGVGITKEPQDPQSLSGDLVQRAQKRCFLVQGIAGVGEETGGDVQASVLDKGKGSGIPCGIASGFKGRPQTAGGERTGIGLALDEFLTGEIHDYLAVTGGGDEGIVLFGGDAGHRLEPVGIVGSTLFDGPDLHGIRNLISHIQRKLGTGNDTLLPCVIYFRRKPLLHSSIVENICTENFGDVDDLIHVDASFRAEYYGNR